MSEAILAMSEAMDSAVDNGSKSEQLSDGRFEYKPYFPSHQRHRQVRYKP